MHLFSVSSYHQLTPCYQVDLGRLGSDVTFQQKVGFAIPGRCTVDDSAWWCPRNLTVKRFGFVCGRVQSRTIEVPLPYFLTCILFGFIFFWLQLVSQARGQRAYILCTVIKKITLQAKQCSICSFYFISTNYKYTNPHIVSETQSQLKQHSLRT